MGYIFVDKGDVAIFYTLAIMLFAEVFCGIIQVDMFAKNREWFYAIGSRIRGMPRPIVFPIAWTILYILIWISMFIFYRNTDYATSPSSLVDAVTILLVLNLMANKSWTYVFFQARQTIAALVMIVFIFGSGAPIVILLGINSRTTELGIFIAYPLWCIYAFYLNLTWVIVEQTAVKPTGTPSLSSSKPQQQQQLRPQPQQIQTRV